MIKYEHNDSVTTAEIDKKLVDSAKLFLGSVEDHPIAVLPSDRFRAFFWDHLNGPKAYDKFADIQYDIAGLLDAAVENKSQYIIFKPIER